MPKKVVAVLIFYPFLCSREEVRPPGITSFALMLRYGWSGDDAGGKTEKEEDDDAGLRT